MGEHLSLWDAVRDHEPAFVEALSACVHSALLSLGNDIYKLEWANIAVSSSDELAKAA